METLLPKTLIFSLRILAEGGVEVYQANLGLGDFVVTFRNAHHSSLSTRFIVGETTNFACPNKLK